MALAYFPTPTSIALDLATRVLSHVDKARLVVLDACAGLGVLGHAIRAVGQERIHSLCYVEADENLAKKIEIANGDAALQADILAPRCERHIASADIIVSNPPFLGIGQYCREMDASTTPDNWHGLRDIGCVIALHLVEAARPDAVIGLILRRDFLFGSGYANFRERLQLSAEILDFQTLGRRLKADSGSAAGAMVICRRRRVSARSDPDQRKPWGSHPAYYDPPAGWSRLKEVATVTAGPSVRGAIQTVPEGSLSSLLLTFEEFEQQALWKPTYRRPIGLDSVSYSAVRGREVWGLEGVAYKLAASRFTCVIVPSKSILFSSTPFIVPIKVDSLDLITGCALIPQWRDFVRASVRSMNFSPLAVAEVPIPIEGAVADELALVGSLARARVDAAVKNGAWAIVDSELQERSDRIGRVMRSVLDLACRTSRRSSTELPE